MNNLSGKGKLYRKGDLIAEVAYEIWGSASERGHIVSGPDPQELYLRFSVEPLEIEMEDGRRFQISMRNMHGVFDIES